MPDYSRTTVFILTPLIFRYHLPLKSLEHLKNFSTVRVPYLGLELTMHVLKSQIHLVRKSFYNIINKSGMYV